jgi:hypothetical protein
MFKRFNRVALGDGQEAIKFQRDGVIKEMGSGL